MYSRRRCQKSAMSEICGVQKRRLHYAMAVDAALMFTRSLRELLALDGLTEQWLHPVDSLLYPVYRDRFRRDTSGREQLLVFDVECLTWLTAEEFYERSRAMAVDLARRGYLFHDDGDDEPTGGWPA